MDGEWAVSGWGAARVFGTAALALSVLTVLAPPTAAAAAGAATPPTAGPTAGWRWPLPAPPLVLRRFDPPATPFSAGHRGVDLAGAIGTPVTAAGAGVVAFAGRLAGRGVVTVVHPALRTTYEPVDATVRVGQLVRAGTQLGWLSAPTGHCGPGRSCLHWGAVRGSEYVDPLLLVGAVGVRLLPLLGGAPSRSTVDSAVDAVGAAPTAPRSVRSVPPGSDPAGRPAIDARPSRTPPGAAAAAGATVVALGGLSGLALRRARRGR